MQTFWKCTDSSAISFVSAQQTPLCPLLNGLQLCTIFKKKDHVFENFGEILSTFDTSLANRKQKKNSTFAFFFNFFFVDFFSKFGKKIQAFQEIFNFICNFRCHFAAISVVFAAKPAVILRDFDKILQILKFFKQNVNKILRGLVKFKIKMNTTNAIFFPKFLLIFPNSQKKCKRFGNAPIHQQFSLFLCSKCRCVRC